jgi:hypothetical protein
MFFVIASNPSEFRCDFKIQIPQVSTLEQAYKAKIQHLVLVIAEFIGPIRLLDSIMSTGVLDKSCRVSQA